MAGSATYNNTNWTARDAIAITASNSNDVFGNAYNYASAAPNTGRACRALWSNSTQTVDLVMATGQLRTGIVLQPGENPFQVIQLRTTNTPTGVFALI
jgi:hypothetical protein